MDKVVIVEYDPRRSAALKRDLAIQFETLRQAYTEAKTDYITRITALAKQEK